MSRDFTIRIYKELLEKFQQKGYVFITFEKWCELENTPSKYVILRHDVDEMANNALIIAELENRMGIKSTFSFRIVRQSNQPDIIKRIAALGHEVSYHYEDLAQAAGDYEKAIKSFRENLAYFRNFYPVKTISMHGSSTSPYDNRDLWKKYDFYDEGIIGEPYLSFTTPDIYYLTDTGFKWDGFDVNVRDKVESHFDNTYHHTEDIIKSINADEFPQKVMMLAHTLWTDNVAKWYFIYFRELVRNKVKRLSKNNKFVQKIYGSFVKFYWKR